MARKKKVVEQEEPAFRPERSSDVVTMDDVRSIEQKREQERREISARLDAIARQVDEDAAVPFGCGGGMCGLLGLVRRASGRRRVQSSDTQFLAKGMERSDALSQREISVSLFGKRSGKTKQERAVDRLQGASMALSTRVESLDEKADECKREAARLMKAGEKAKAMRMLKKSKQAAAHAGSLQQAADAVERQTNMMEDVSLQTQIASALEATMGQMKTSKKALASVEKVADEAGDIRDLNEDIQAALAQLNDGSSLALDDDELEAELAGMLHEESQEQNTQSTQPTPEPAKADERTSHYKKYPSTPNTAVVRENLSLAQ